MLFLKIKLNISLYKMIFVYLNAQKQQQKTYRKTYIEYKIMMIDSKIVKSHDLL